ncbi:unnamed protein product [Arabidopsis thaliana]|uniref:Uncharacterized protein n=1 Tax=Arabidopsis thaliana TaxID=3702 RepID=A0A5S9YC92_ARATH|nr:unnamed protein product [Arabidopsis thaliana]
MQNPNSSSSLVDSTSAPKRYTPPNQRNRSSNRRRSRGWTAAMHLYNDPSVDLSERPMMYYGGDVWGKLPH